MSYQYIRLVGIAIFILNVIISAQVMAQSNNTAISFAIVPQQSASTLAKVWGPVLNYLEQRTGRRFVFRTATNIPTFEQRLAAGEYDIAYMNPYHYTVFHESPGYVAVAKARNKLLRGVLVVHKDAEIDSLQALAGKIIAFPAPAAFAASVLPQAHLRQAGIAITPKYVSSHDSVYRAVARGFNPAGGGVMRTFDTVNPKVREQLRILWKTPGYTSHAIAAHPRLSADFVEQVVKLLVEMDKRPESAQLLKNLKIKGFETAEDATWNDVRELNIDIAVGVKN